MTGLLLSGIQPNLIHGVDMIVQRLDTASTMYDETYREPVNDEPVYKAPEAIIAQIHWVDQNDLVSAPAGDDNFFDGWITMLKVDVDAMVGGPFKKGDKIVKVDDRDFSEDPLVIEKIKHNGHYREAKLVKFWFRTRSESLRNDQKDR